MNHVGMNLGEEWEEVSNKYKKVDGNYRKLQKSRVNPLYIYVPREVFRVFRKKHKTFINAVPYENHCALMLEESKSLSDICKSRSISENFFFKRREK
jgi:hypothetical protein